MHILYTEHHFTGMENEMIVIGHKPCFRIYIIIGNRM